MTQKLVIELENDEYDVHALREEILDRYGGVGNIKCVNIIQDE